MRCRFPTVAIAPVGPKSPVPISSHGWRRLELSLIAGRTPAPRWSRTSLIGHRAARSDRPSIIGRGSWLVGGEGRTPGPSYLSAARRGSRRRQGTRPAAVDLPNSEMDDGRLHNYRPARSETPDLSCEKLAARTRILRKCHDVAVARVIAAIRAPPRCRRLPWLNLDVAHGHWRMSYVFRLMRTPVLNSSVN